MARRFRITTTGRVGPPRWWWVIVHGSLEQMRRAAIRWPYTDDTAEDLAEALGLCQPMGWWENDDEPGVRYYPETGYAGVLRFTVGHTGPEIVGHELVHAAVATYRMNVSSDACLGERCGDEEEDLAYLYGELYASFRSRY